jgi:hypothetical protein
MPVYLDAIPELAPRIPRPNTRRWLYFLGIILASGIALTFWLWTEERTVYVFWCMALGLPVCLWGLFFSLRRFGYKCDQVWASSWNREREQLLEREITRGQRAVSVLKVGVVTQLGSGPEKLLHAVMASTSQLTMQPPRAGGAPVRHTRLADFQHKQQAHDLDIAVKTLVSQIKPVLDKIPADVPCWLMVDCEVAGVPDAEAKIPHLLALQTDRKFQFFHAKGLAALDNWLDEMWKTPAALIIVSAVIRETPLEGEGEAIAWLLLLNRNHADFPDAVRLHRPEKGCSRSLSKTLSRALLWCQLPPAGVRKAWMTGSTVSQGGSWNMACENNELTLSMTEDNKDIDQTTGYTGKAAPWLAVAIATTAAQQGDPQIVVAQTDVNDIWIAGITPGDITGINQDLS